MRISPGKKVGRGIVSTTTVTSSRYMRPTKLGRYPWQQRNILRHWKKGGGFPQAHQPTSGMPEWKFFFLAKKKLMTSVKFLTVLFRKFWAKS